MKLTNNAKSASQLRAMFHGSDCAVIGWISFDERCSKLVKTLGADCITDNRFFWFAESRGRIAEHKEHLETLFGDRALGESRLDRSNQVGGFEKIQKAVRRFLKKSDKLIVDISAFPREYVCMFLTMWSELPTRKNINVIYNVASDYSYLDKRIGDKWLSKGVGDVQSVYGYSGLTIPGRDSVLIGLAGFDDERFCRIAEVVDPVEMKVGRPISKDISRKWITRKIDTMIRRLRYRFKEVEVFEFDCDEIEPTRAVLTECIGDVSREMNVVLCPNNNKLSTIALSLAALNNRRSQVVFAPARIYNTAAYAKASNVFNLIGSLD